MSRGTGQALLNHALMFTSGLGNRSSSPLGTGSYPQRERRLVAAVDDPLIVAGAPEDEDRSGTGDGRSAEPGLVPGLDGIIHAHAGLEGEHRLRVGGEHQDARDLGHRRR